jgi:hypothetical protein
MTMGQELMTVVARVQSGPGKALFTAALGVAMLIALAVAGAAGAQVTITSPGPMASIYLSGDLGCQVTMTNDRQGVFFNGSQLGGCGTFLQSGSLGPAIDSGNAELFSPASLPGATQQPTENYTPVSQSAVTGAGTSASPYAVTTVVNACVPSATAPPLAITGCTPGDAWVAQLQETDSYVVGTDVYGTQIVITNESGQTLAGTLYHTGDCFLAGDTGYGGLGGASQNAPACLLTPGDSPPARAMSFIPLTAGSSYYEGAYTTDMSPRGTSFWGYVTPAGTPYPSTIDATTDEDNGIGLSWPYSLAIGGTATVAFATVVAPNNPPTNTAAPAVTGSHNVGHVLSCSRGTWSSALPITYTYQWLRAGNPIAGATSSTYKVESADNGRSLACQVSANTDRGFTSVTSAPLFPPPPPPVLGKEANFGPVSGTVYVKPPPGAKITVNAVAKLTTGKGFIPLTQALQLPVGTQVDARAGKLRLTLATSKKTKRRRARTQSGLFFGGLFKVSQSGSQRLKGLTTLRLLDNGAFPGAPSYTQCTASGKRSHAIAVIAKKKPLSKKVLNILGANEHGSYKTQGKYSAATVRGTQFTVSDRCDGTLTHVSRGAVVVTDFRTHQQHALHTGQSYFAKP